MILVVVYCSMLYDVCTTREYVVEEKKCREKGQQIRRNVKVGHVWVVCKEK